MQNFKIKVEFAENSDNTGVVIHCTVTPAFEIHPRANSIRWRVKSQDNFTTYTAHVMRNYVTQAWLALKEELEYAIDQYRELELPENQEYEY